MSWRLEMWTLPGLVPIEECSNPQSYMCFKILSRQKQEEKSKEEKSELIVNDNPLVFKTMLKPSDF